MEKHTWFFVKVEDGKAPCGAADPAAESSCDALAGQITSNGWEKLDGIAGVYYKCCGEGAESEDPVVFKNFRMAGGRNANSDETARVVITAYTMQKNGLATAKDAWAAACGK